MAEGGEIEVNGKIDLGTRRLVFSHVENAASFFAYIEADQEVMETIVAEANQECSNLPRLAEAPSLDQVVGMYCSKDKNWYRGRIEQLNQGERKDKFRVRAIDFGWNQVVGVGELCELPEVLQAKKSCCEKYKMTDMKPKGKHEGYSASDRQRGADWLKRVVNNRVVIASCHKQVNYAGGIMADCMVGDLNLNKTALKQGHVILLPSIMGNFATKKKTTGQKNINQNMVANHYSSYVNGSAAQTVDLDYSAYQDNSFMRSQAGKKAQAKSPGSKTAEVKKLEKKISEDKKTINELKKTTSLDTGVKEITKLMDKVKAARARGEEEECKGNFIVNCLAGVAEVIEVSSLVTERYLYGIEAVEAAARRVSEEEKEGVKEGQDVKASKSDLHQCIHEYLKLYSEEEVQDEVSRVSNQLSNMDRNIPGSWKQMGFKVESVTREHLLQVASNVKTWLDESVSREVAANENSKKEIENLCKNLTDLSNGLQQQLVGDPVVEIPKSIDSQLLSARRALQQELNCLTGATVKTWKKGKTESSDATVLKSAWRALSTLKNQLEMAKKKQTEYENMSSTLGSLIS